jgi:transcriptional regulator with XRE-family HTH domain
MPGIRRSAIVVEAKRRARERGARIGGEIRAMRSRRKWTQAEIGLRTGLGRMTISRLERGDGPLDLETLDRVGLALGVPLAVGFDRDTHDVADAGHLAMQELVLGITRGCGFVRQFEMPTRPSEPWRSADLGLASDARRLAIDAECWNTFGDVGAAARSSRRKLVELEELAVARWGERARARLVWIVRETARNRALIHRYPQVFASLFTGSSRGWVATLTTGSEPPEAPGLLWCDLASGRLHAWNRPHATGDVSRQQR